MFVDFKLCISGEINKIEREEQIYEYTSQFVALYLLTAEFLVSQKDSFQLLLFYYL